MEPLFNIDLKRIPSFKDKETADREKNFELFLKGGFPNKKDENWKFSDLNFIISKNFKNITNNDNYKFDKKIELINDFDHNKIILVNGLLNSYDLQFEEIGKVKIESLKSFEGFNNQIINNLDYLNKALSIGGFNLEVQKDYKCKKPIIIYNYFNSNLDNKIINNSNKIKLSQNSELTLIEYNIGEKSKFIKNTFEKINIDKNAVLKNITLQKTKSNGYFYKNISGTQDYNSSYQNFILSSGLKFNKIEIDMNLEKEKSNCYILSGLNLGKDEHQEIKTQINHLAPDCKSYQKIKNVLESDSNGVYQGKIFVKNIAQKTDAYQLSKALILNDNAEFSAKPELEIYADDVKCSHGSTSGSIDAEAIHYLMTRGIELRAAKKLLIKGFLNEIFDNIPEEKIRTFLDKSIEVQIDEI
ncbi:Fe-S cluster assembly protein SufD [Candidatus Pelagibacter communis]|uniref:Fe-S cluster assembly protein SufD n=1 Tax=Pelagibacter ubique TaxID=198252 RepID=UPI00094C0BD7|nr:Fe-S cluster assembly protein SufD [Candidatus Pelagibacter ubique]